MPLLKAELQLLIDLLVRKGVLNRGEYEAALTSARQLSNAELLADLAKEPAPNREEEVLVDDHPPQDFANEDRRERIEDAGYSRRLDSPAAQEIESSEELADRSPAAQRFFENQAKARQD